MDMWTGSPSLRHMGRVKYQTKSRFFHQARKWDWVWGKKPIVSASIYIITLETAVGTVVKEHTLWSEAVGSNLTDPCTNWVRGTEFCFFLKKRIVRVPHSEGCWEY